MKEMLETFRQKRTLNAPLERGELPKVALDKAVIAEQCVVSFFIALFSFGSSFAFFFNILKAINPFKINLEPLVTLLAFSSASFFVALFLAWPCFYTFYLKRKTGHPP